jgi:hypothetical protein
MRTIHNDTTPPRDTADTVPLHTPVQSWLSTLARQEQEAEQALADQREHLKRLRAKRKHVAWLEREERQLMIAGLVCTAGLGQEDDDTLRDTFHFLAAAACEAGSLRAWLDGQRVRAPGDSPHERNSS